MEFHKVLPPGLSVEQRGRRLYLYARVRVAGRLYARYVGPVDPVAAAGLVVEAEVGRDRRRWAARHARDRAAAVLGAGAGFDQFSDHLTRAAMHLAGYHRHHRGEWRRRCHEDSFMPPPHNETAPPLPPTARPARPPLVAIAGGNPEMQELLSRAARGDRSVLPRVRELLTRPAFARAVGDIADFAREALIGRVAGDHVAVAEGVRQKVVELEAGFLADCGPDPSLAERVAAGRAAHAWVTVHHLEVLLTKERVGTPGRTAVDKDLGRAERRLQAALKGLAALRRLRGPAVKVTQVNVAGAETVVVQ